MTCAEVQDRLQAYLDGELDTAESCSLAAHTMRCCCCRKALEEQRACHRALEAGLLSCCHSHGRRDLAERAFARLDCPIPRLRRCRWALAGGVAALLAVGFLGYFAYCKSSGVCRWVAAATDLYDRVATGRAEILLTSDDIEHVRDALTLRLEERIPALSRCHLKPDLCGQISVGECKGVFVTYSGKEPTDTAMLLVLPTHESPSGSTVLESFTASSYRNHSVLSWHAGDHDALYILVTRLPLQESLALAEVASDEVARQATQSLLP
jgi:hypothetical protein